MKIEGMLSNSHIVPGVKPEKIVKKVKGTETTGAVDPESSSQERQKKWEQQLSDMNKGEASSEEQDTLAPQSDKPSLSNGINVVA